MSKNEFDDMKREEREYEARIDAYYEPQEVRRRQDLQRQRMMNGGYTDEELMTADEDFDEEDEYGII